MSLDLAGPPPDANYRTRLGEVTARVRAAEDACGRAGAGTRILVATKTWNARAARDVVEAGARLIGESRMQELAEKGPALGEIGVPVHVIGQLQRNKAAVAVDFATCVQTVDSERLAERLSRLALEREKDLDVMIQVNVSGEESKAGVSPGEALELAVTVQSMPALRVTGFMTIGLNSHDEGAVRAGYARLREVRDQALVRAERGDVDLREAWELSMGMSRDVEWAVAEGATMVRVGSAIMGPRP